MVEFVLAFGYALRCRTVPLQWGAILRPGHEMLRRCVHYSAPVLANETLWGLAYSMMTVIMGHMTASGDLLAAYTVAGNIDKLTTAGIFGLANAAAVIVGKEIGVGNRAGVLSIGSAVCFTSFMFGVALGGAELVLFSPCCVPRFCRSFGSQLRPQGSAPLWCFPTRSPCPSMATPRPWSSAYCAAAAM